MHYLHTYITPLVVTYVETLKDAFADINTYLDERLESEDFQNFIIALIISTPFVGTVLFVGAIMMSV